MSDNKRRPVHDYAPVGDAHAAAPASSDGSANRRRLPRFDSPAVFRRLPDPRRVGHFRLGPATGRRAASERAYF